ncbi:NUDIX domain-containing protein [Pediococcus siamensis]|uniref:NUDIX domain-containing protein n=1 Tax=Pediococcus siamensis TaxID=381829 RepID=UPI00399F0320
MSKKYHRAFGVYGILGDPKGLIVIKKNGGPYRNRYDLPGGSLEDGESLDKAILREFKEETGLEITTLTQLGVTSFKYPWDYEKWHYNQHICVFYHIHTYNGQLADHVTQFVGQDAIGAGRVPLTALNEKNGVYTFWYW